MTPSDSSHNFPTLFWAFITVELRISGLDTFLAKLISFLDSWNAVIMQECKSTSIDLFHGMFWKILPYDIIVWLLWETPQRSHTDAPWNQCWNMFDRNVSSSTAWYHRNIGSRTFSTFLRWCHSCGWLDRLHNFAFLVCFLWDHRCFQVFSRGIVFIWS